MVNKDMKGIITYIYLENFVTYNKVEVKPGRNLNVIIGPNGTGKSTIVCAIVLGLGGKPSTIGRALHVKEYVKAGCEEAKIEIHLKNDTARDIVIKRVFNIQGKTSWFVDDKISNIEAVKKLTQTLNIQVDNLCQFLPQDKVQEFSKLNAQELLENTEKSVADPVILEYHKKLIELRNMHKGLNTDIEGKKKLLQTKTQIYDGLKESVSNVKERKLIKKKIVALKQKKAWMFYDLKRKDLLKLKNKREEVLKTVTTLESEAKPINDAIEKIGKEISTLRISINNNNNRIESEKRNLKKLMDDIIECEKLIKDCESTCKQRIQAEKTRDQEIELERQRKEKHESDLTNIMLELDSEETLSRRKQELTRNIDEQRGIINALVNKSSALKQEEEKMALDIRSLEADLQLLNIESKRLQLLRERNMDAYKATIWLRDNRHRFSGTIHEPMLLSINVKNESYAKYLENIISWKDLVAFVCENKQDMNLLLRCLRDEQKLQVNVVHSDPDKYIQMEPSIPLEHIRKFGFTYYLVSLLDAPIAIMKYLVSMYNLNNIPVGTKVVDECTDHIPSSLHCYFSADNVYIVRISKYSKEKSSRMKPVTKSGLLSIVLDKSKLQRIENDLTRLREEKIKLNSLAKRKEEEIVEQNKKLDKYRADRNKLQQDVQQVQLLKSRIAMSTKKIEDLQNERTSIESIRETIAKKIKLFIAKQLRLYSNYNSKLEDWFTSETANEQVKLALKMQTRQLRIKTNDSQDLRDRLREAEEQLQQMSSEIQPMKTEVQKLYKEAMESTDSISPNDAAFAPINKAFQKLPPTIEEINTELNVAQAKVFCMGNNVDAENVLREYEEVKSDMHNLEQMIKEQSARLETAQSEMESLQEKWLTPLREIVHEINKNFSTHFSAMNCAGEVALHHGENHLDYDQYGLKIRVKFRDTDQLQELTRHHQSGGERAVTTAIYMIALQELSRVPFRCVDEINQGMDATNERRVFNLLVKITAKSTSSQYFFLTPKLLPDLEYAETVTVHCVFNGPFVISHTEFDTEEYCKHIKNVLKQTA